MKIKRVRLSLCLIGLLTGLFIVYQPKPEVVISNTSSKLYADVSELENRSLLIVTGKGITQETQPIYGGYEKKVVEDAITKTTFQIETIVKNDTDAAYEKGDSITVYEQAGIVEKTGRDTYFSTDGYKLMEEGSSYMLFLFEGVEEGDWVIGGYQGKHNIDGNDQKETEFLQGKYKVQFESMQKSLLKEYKDAIKE